MKKILPVCFLLLMWESHTFSQPSEKQPVKFLFRFYDDNDFLNINLHGTDKSYTNGLRLDIFYTKSKAAHPFLIGLFVKEESENRIVYGWSLSQLMFTPNDLSKTAFQPDDYSYAGALTLTHTLATYNHKGKFSFQTGVTAGIRGSPAMSEGVQKFVHKMIHDEMPQGWHHQLKTSPLLNFSFSAEKQIGDYREILEVIGGTELAAGIMLNAVSVYPILRIGLMNSYFEGILNQFSSDVKQHKSRKMQLYLTVKPKVSLVISNAMIQGQVINNQEGMLATKNDQDISNMVAELEYGIVIVYRHFGIAYTQKPSTAYKKGLYGHNVGNISLYFSH